MELKKAKDIPSSQKIWNVMRFGLLLHVLRNKLGQIGLDVKPYYWVEEEIENFKEPVIKGSSSEFIFKCFGPKEINLICQDSTSTCEKEILKLLDKGNLFVGLVHNSEIVAYTFIELNNFIYNHRTFKLHKNEAYFFNLRTTHSFRGKNLAAYLNYLSYQLLKNQGIDKKYSIVEYFNKSSVKFKKKLNPRYLKFYLYIGLFKKYHWNFVLRKYN